PLWREDLMNAQGVPIIGLGERTAETADLPLQWMPHMQVADVAASVARALELGGNELMHGKDDAGKSQWAVIGDPNGAAFGLIPVVAADQLPPSDENASSEAEPSVGHIAWLDLTVPNAEATRDFYCQVVGWSAEDVPMQDTDESYADYNMVGGDGQPAAGICHARGANEGLPPNWLIYLPVGDLDESLRRVSEEGGKVVKDSTSPDGSFRYAVIQDPVGATFALAPA
ncbi:VOC family protein, partial [Opitutaceae bacterium]|nr:VOC family protein [Opitutaceae bacterium]